MRSCLKSFGLWEYIDQDKEVPPFRANPTITQMKQHEEETLKKEKLSHVYIKVHNHKVVEKMLINLPVKFEAKVAAIEESCDLKKLTISEMVSKLQAHEQRFSIRMDDVTEGAFQARHKGKQAGQKNQKKQNYKASGDQKGKTKMDGSSESAANNYFPPCSICKRINHLLKDCWYKGKPQI
uniref:Retrovirus-related Pol polyprotein from transposon TNT 1-94 n=1 Tax=Cajanus cajan TaxID=3821 RepID=A0A151R0W4_CAJCA|nr:hypothetical protein KK1_042685 [Cajanus cajan]